MNVMITVLLFIAAIVSLGASQATQPALEPPECPLETQIAFSQTLPNARVCAPSIGAVLTPLNAALTSERRSAIIDNLDNVCIDNCGGMFADFLASENCNDTLGAITLEVFCIPTNGGAAIGPYCRFASGDLDQTIFNALLACDNSTICASGCRDALIELKSQIGCCYQNLYNNTEYLMELLNTQFLPQFAFDRLQLLNDPLGNPWDACNVNAPQECTAEPFGKKLMFNIKNLSAKLIDFVTACFHLFCMDVSNDNIFFPCNNNCRMQHL